MIQGAKRLQMVGPKGSSSAQEDDLVVAGALHGRGRS